MSKNILLAISLMSFSAIGFATYCVAPPCFGDDNKSDTQKKITENTTPSSQSKGQ